MQWAWRSGLGHMQWSHTTMEYRVKLAFYTCKEPMHAFTHPQPTDTSPARSHPAAVDSSTPYQTIVGPTHSTGLSQCLIRVL
jgi:hypothetical protein